MEAGQSMVCWTPSVALGIQPTFPPPPAASLQSERAHCGICHGVSKQRRRVVMERVALFEEELGPMLSPASNGGGATKRQHHLRQTPSKQRTKRSKSSSTAMLVGGGGAVVVPARCSYRTGKCQNLQAIKRNGKLHKLCEFHRARANLNQKKLDRKKRLQRSKSATPSPRQAVVVTNKVEAPVESPRTVDGVKAFSSVFPTEESVPVLPTSLDEAPLALGCEELAIFCSLMTFDTNHSVESPPTGMRACHQYTSIV